jgi:hypothetical protein
MAVSIVQSKSNANGGASAAVSVTLTSAVTPGNAVVWVGTCAGGYVTFVSMTDNKSNTYPAPDVNEFQGTGFGSGVAIGCLPNCPNNPQTFTFTVSSNAPNDIDIRVYEVSGLATSSPLDVAKGVIIASGASPLSTTYTTTTSTDFAVSSWVNSSADTTAISGWTLDDTYSSGNWGTAHFISPASGTDTYSMTNSGTTAALVGIAAYKAASTGTNYSLTATNGSYGISGKLTHAGYGLGASAGSYAINGQAANLTKFHLYNLSAASGSYSITAETAGLTWSGAAAHNYDLVANAGSYNISGASNTRGFGINAGYAVYTISGSTGGLSLSANIPSHVGSKNRRWMNRFQR